jgi:hypothetical protein
MYRGWKIEKTRGGWVAWRGSESAGLWRTQAAARAAVDRLEDRPPAPAPATPDPRLAPKGWGSQ